MRKKTFPNVVLGGDTEMDAQTYRALYQESIDSPETFWGNQAKERLTFFEPFKTVMSGGLEAGDVKWFEEAKLNVCYNCVDRHLETRADQTAILWQGDEPSRLKRYNYQELHESVCRFSNLLKKYNVKKGDRVCIYLPMIPEAVFAMLACARIGAVHSVVFAGFSPAALADRINDADCKLVITADAGVRGGSVTQLKRNVDLALKKCSGVSNVIVVNNLKLDIDWFEPRDVHYEEEVQALPSECPVESMQAEDPLFILYTSGSTGKPKGVLHTQAGYLLYAAMTHKVVFDYQDGDIYWCTADVGWITGHSYIVYGPLCNGATTLVFEGTPTYPTPSRFWEIIDKHKVSTFYTAPTAIRLLMGAGDAYLKKSTRRSLRVLGTVGEPINPEAWQWYYASVGRERCPVVDTWWQTETGGIMISSLPGAEPLKPGSATKPFFGIIPALVSDDGKIIEGEGVGKLVVTRPWPGMLRGIYGDKQRYLETYLSQFPGAYTTGDGAIRDANNDYTITGRIDDVINVSGHRVGTAEIESALAMHTNVIEAAVVSVPHEIKGEGIYAYVSLKNEPENKRHLIDELQNKLRESIGAFAKVDHFQWVSGLPKTRSGKIMRRILRKTANGEKEDFGDISTLANPEIMSELVV